MMINTILLLVLAATPVQDAPRSPDRPTRKRDVAVEPVEVAPQDAKLAIADSVKFLLEVQEGPSDSEWPYEGVYRMPGDGPKEFISRGLIIPMGYRVGGTSIAGMALLRSTDELSKRNEALERARTFVVEATASPYMVHEYAGGYDVRGWGYIYGARFLMAMQAAGLVPKDQAEAHRAATDFYVTGIEAIEIPTSGGWNYSRRGALDKSGAASPFMTAPALQALFEAKRAGIAFDPETVDRGLVALKNSRTDDGHIAYSAQGQTRESSKMIPGAIGRMVAVETVRSQAGQGSPEDLRRALDAFNENWNELLKRKSKSGTHARPYGVAPYYFFYAHGYAAEAIEELPEADRAPYRKKLMELLFSTREKDGVWNDRVFPRSRAYGTSIALQVITQPEAPPAARWNEAGQ